jgi:aspergillopepsin I
VNKANGFWEFTGAGYAVGSDAFVTSPIDAIADTGTTLLLMDNSVVSAYYAQVSGAAYDSTQGGYTFPCSATLPSFTLGIGSYKAVIPGTYMNYAPATGSCKSPFLHSCLPRSTKLTLLHLSLLRRPSEQRWD